MTLRARRTRWAAIRCADALYLDVAALLRGETRLDREPELRAFSALTGEEHELTRPELDALLDLPLEDWSDADGPLVDELERKGLVVVAGRDSEGLDGAITDAHWNPTAALYHARGRWSGVDLPLHTLPEAASALGDRAAVEFVDTFGPPPPHFHAVAEPLATLELPLVDVEGGLFDALSRRQTSRVFDRSRGISLEQLATLLRAVFGAQALATITDDAVGVRKTSPSGGGLHPVEAYPLVCGVEGVEPGVHHYHVGDHTLELVERLDEEEARSLALAFTCGQGYFRDASVLVVLAARFERSFWKYRGHEKAYAVTLMDAGHLSQTFYLVCAELGLGAFVTAAINNADVDDRLGLDGFAQGSLAIVGCGPVVAASSYLQPEFTPHRPPR